MCWLCGSLSLAVLHSSGPCLANGVALSGLGRSLSIVDQDKAGSTDTAPGHLIWAVP